jgi:hypothetical protein
VIKDYIQALAVVLGRFGMTLKKCGNKNPRVEIR